MSYFNPEAVSDAEYISKFKLDFENTVDKIVNQPLEPFVLVLPPQPIMINITFTITPFKFRELPFEEELRILDEIPSDTFESRLAMIDSDEDFFEYENMSDFEDVLESVEWAHTNEFIDQLYDLDYHAAQR